MRTYRLVALALVAALGASCASADDEPTSSESPLTTTAAPNTTQAAVTTVPTTDPSTTVATPPATDAPNTTTAPEAPTTTVFVAPESELPVVPAPFALSGTPAEQAAAITAALADPASDRSAVALAAFGAAGLPVLLADGTSLTSTTDPIGLPWSIVASTVQLASPQMRVSLTELVRLLGMVDPLADFDVAASANEIAAAMRAELAAPTASGPALVAHLVAAESLAYDGTVLADPTTTADRLHVSTTTALLIGTGVIRATTGALADAGELKASAPGISSGFAGGQRPSEEMGLANGCDDGVGGWGLWIASKITTGVTLAPGVEWRGLYTTLVELSVNRGSDAVEMLEFTEGAGKASAVTFAALNVALFIAQVSGRQATAKMDGEGPLVRTKKSDEYGGARQITLRIIYEAGDPKIVKHRNCMLAAMALIGNNAQIATGAATNVIVRTSGATGFPTSLAAGDSTVIFGPGEFQIEQPTDDNGRIKVPVQGQRQKTDKSDVENAVQKEFGVFFEATLEPMEASQLGRAFADDALCVASAATGQAVQAVAECQNALINIMRQFRWDIGEFTFPLTDWEAGGWQVDGFIDPFQMTGIKCDGVGGPWFLNLSANFEGAVFDGVIDGVMDEDSGTGTFTLSGIYEYGGLSQPLDGKGTMTYVQTGEDTAQLILEGEIEQGGFGGGTLELTRTSCE